MSSEPVRVRVPGGALGAPARMIWPLLLALAIAAGMHFFVGPNINGTAVQVLLFAGINITLAVSLTMVNGFTGQFSIGHAGFMAVGGYVAGGLVYYLSAKFFDSPQVGFHGGLLSAGTDYRPDPDNPLPLLSKGDVIMIGSCLVGGLFAAGAGYLVGLPTLRLRGDYLAIVTLGFGEIVRVIFQGTGSQVLFTKAQEMRDTPFHQLAWKLGGAQGFNFIPIYATLFWVFLLASITVAVALRLKYSSPGRAMISIREDEVAAQAMGVNVTRYKVRAFVLASFFAGLAGAMAALSIGQMNASAYGFIKSFDIIIMIVLGGLGSVSGAVLAATVLTILPEALRQFDSYRMIAYALLLIIIMILRPQGLLGIREVWELGPVRRLVHRVRRRGGAS